MSDQYIMDNYLLLLKSNVEVYVHGTLESSNSDIKDLLKSSLDDTMDKQASTYDEMTKRNWYKVNNIKESEISKVLNKVNSN